MGERAYEVSVLLGSAFGALYYGLRLDRDGSTHSMQHLSLAVRFSVLPSESD